MSLVLRQDRGPVAVLTLNRSERHNSLVPEMLDDLLSAVVSVKGDPSVRAVILQANGRSFSTGGDAQGFVDNLDRIEEYSRHLVGLLNKVILALMDLPVPVIAAVHGIVTGGSIGLVRACDIVLISPEASFTPYYCALGVSPDGGWVALLAPELGKQRMASVLMLNQTISAKQAVEWGIAYRLVPAGEIRVEAMKTAEIIIQHKPGSISRVKKLLHQDREEIAQGLEAEREHFVRHMATPEGRAAFVTFLRDRKPKNV